MARTFEWMIPLAIGLLIYAVAVRLLIERGWALGLFLLAVFLVMHGLIHVGFANPAAAPADGIDYPFDLGRSWLVGAGVDASLVRAVGVGLVVVVAIGFAVAGLATLGWLVPTTWWPTLVAVASIASLALLVVGLSPMLVLGFAVDAALLWLVLGMAWSPGTSALPA